MASKFSSIAMPRVGPMRGIRFCGRCLGYGCLFGIAIAALDFAYYFPLTTPPHTLGVKAFLSSVFVWSGEFMLLTLIVAYFENRITRHDPPVWQLVLIVLFGTAAAVVSWQVFSVLVLRDLLGVRLFRDYLGQPVVLIGGILYHGWMVLFFGGLAAGVYAAQRWRTRTLAAVRAAELSRAMSERHLSEARLASLQRQVEPDVILRSLSTLERLYNEDPATADKALDALIVLLRQALADLRDSASSAGPVSRSRVRNGILREEGA
jgi:hypothetical protein